MFTLLKQSKKSKARLGNLQTAHGDIKTPFFMPIATKGSVKSLDSQELLALKSQIILANTYHLYLQPGLTVLKKSKGLHNFMDWNGPILTDSGGYQVFSLSARTRQGKSLRSLSKSGVEFRSFLDGSKHLFTPAKVQAIQDIIGSDLKMVLDVCSPYPCSKKQANKDLELTQLWARKSLRYQQNKSSNKSLLLAIVQGSSYRDLRLKSVQGLLQIEKDLSASWDGLAIGGLAVGESNEMMYKILKYTIPALPVNKLRYLMGVGKPENIVQAVRLGVDMFDCVIPTREARHGRLYKFKTNKLSGKFYEIINISRAKYEKTIQPINDSNLKNYSLAYLRHLFKAGEPLALRLATLNNLKFYLDLLAKIRNEIKKGNL